MAEPCMLSPNACGLTRPLTPPEKLFAYFFISPRRISFLKLKKVFSGGGGYLYLSSSKNTV